MPRWTCALIVAMLAGSIGAGAQTHGLNKDDRKLLEWFAHLDLAPDLSQAPLVRVSEPSAPYRPGEIDAPPFQSLGFLTNETSTTFTVFQLRGLSRQRIAGGPPRAVTFERLDLAAVARETLAWRPAEGERPDALRRIAGTWMSEREIFVLAAGCAAAHLDQPAHDLIAVGRQISRDEDNLRASLRDHFGTDAMAFAFGDYANGGDRAGVRRQLQWIERKLPGFDEFGFVHDTIAALGPMVKEDARRAKHPVRIESLTGREKVRALIEALRDQTGVQEMNPGTVRFVVGIFGTALPPSTASDLVDMGYAAVPDLINSLTDRRLTRGVYRRNGIPRDVLTIGECIEEILKLISGRSFRVLLESGDRDPRASQKRARSWWRDLQTRGERLVLIDGTLAGHDGQARQLAAKYPHDAVMVIPQAIRRDDDQYTRGRMVEALASVRTGEEVMPLRALLNGPDPSIRVAAARALNERGAGDEALDAIIREWNRPIEPTDFVVTDAQMALAEYLANSGSAAIAALGSHWRERHYAVRHSALTELANLSGPESAREAAEAFLVRTLSDPDEARGGSGVMTSTMPNARLCDVAAALLAEHWKDKYTFDGLASLADRDRQIIRLQNVWRAEHGLPALAEPLSRGDAVHPGDPATVTKVEVATREVLAPVDVLVVAFALEGRPLDARSFLSVVSEFRRVARLSDPALQIGVFGNGDGTGVSIRLDFVPHLRTPPDRDDRWACSYIVVVGREPLYVGEDNIPPNALFGPSLVQAIDQALRSAATAAFEIRIGCRRLAER